MTDAEFIDKALGANITEREQQYIDECVKFQHHYDIIVNSLRKSKVDPKRLEHCMATLEAIYRAHDNRYHHVSWAPEVRRIEKFTLS